MVLSNWRENARRHRGYWGFNTLDRISLAAMALGGVLFLGGLLFNADAVAGPGLLLLILGFLMLGRSLPGGPGG